MIKLETLLPLENFEELLERIATCPLKMIDFYQVHNIGLNGRKGTQYRGVEYTRSHHDKMKLELWLEKADLEQVVEMLAKESSGVVPLSISEVEDLRILQGEREGG